MLMQILVLGLECLSRGTESISASVTDGLAFIIIILL